MAKILDRVPFNFRLGRNLVLFLVIILKSLSSWAFECGNVSTNKVTFRQLKNYLDFSFETSVSTQYPFCNAEYCYRQQPMQPAIQPPQHVKSPVIDIEEIHPLMNLYQRLR